jgi:hypothetical protein
LSRPSRKAYADAVAAGGAVQQRRGGGSTLREGRFDL